MKRPPTPEELTAQCARWNAVNPVGTHVDVQMDSGKVRETLTRTSAQILGAEPSRGYIGHTAVIWLEGITGCYLLSRVTPRPIPQPRVDRVEVTLRTGKKGSGKTLESAIENAKGKA
jgi:hypothetical protein